jgi:hypothetical protein
MWSLPQQRMITNEFFYFRLLISLSKDKERITKWLFGVKDTVAGAI